MTYIHSIGGPKAICDRCGTVYNWSALRKEWTGLMVCKGCYDPKHPQMSVRAVADRHPHGSTPVGPVVFIEPDSITADDL